MAENTRLVCDQCYKPQEWDGTGLCSWRACAPTGSCDGRQCLDGDSGIAELYRLRVGQLEAEVDRLREVVRALRQQRRAEAVSGEQMVAGLSWTRGASNAAFAGYDRETEHLTGGSPEP